MKYSFSLNIMEFELARNYVHSLNLKSKKEWDIWCKNNIMKKPKSLPTLPNLVYKNNGWVNYQDWLGY